MVQRLGLMWPDKNDHDNEFFCYHIQLGFFPRY